MSREIGYLFLLCAALWLLGASINADPVRLIPAAAFGIIGAAELLRFRR